MPAPIPIPVRRVIFNRWKKGQTPTEIAQALGLSARTTANLVKRFRDKGEAGIETSYDKNGPRMTAQQQRIRQQAETLRRQHPGWGSEVLRIKLKAVVADADLPCSRTIRKWLADSDLSMHTKEAPRVINRPPSAGYPHECWQLDAAEEIELANGGYACWVRLVDEYTGAFLTTRVFPPQEIQHG